MKRRRALRLLCRRSLPQPTQSDTPAPRTKAPLWTLPVPREGSIGGERGIEKPGKTLYD
ncbi:MAG: hypothetical protein LBB68_05395 [Treponema sp.]|nr:hypothetical protein [Treponema sp.]